MEQDDALFRALADPSRRLLLDRLFERDGQTLGELVMALPQMTRIGVMKHLRVLERADLVVSHRAGRRRLHYLNPVPIRRLHDRWLDKFRTRAADVLLTLQTFMEEPTMGTDAETRDRPRAMAQVFIRATPDRVWRAITESEFTTRYYYSSTVESDWKAGSAYRYAIAGEDAIVGTVLEVDPPRRLVLSFDARWDEDVAADAPSQLTWELEETAPGVTKVTTVHEFPSRTATFEQVGGGMSFILSGLKSLIETGEPLVPVEAAASAG
ncbi:MAG: ArsR/SmtB family transcription factor [Candidatus Limnocylindria bacterium]